VRRIDLTLEPLDDHVVIQPSDEESETNLGLIIPASAETDCRTAVVTAVGARHPASNRVTRCCSRRPPATRYGSPGPR
jgi:co-chaperonin GroES (HSP10)